MIGLSSNFLFFLFSFFLFVFLVSSTFSVSFSPRSLEQRLLRCHVVQHHSLAECAEVEVHLDDSGADLKYTIRELSQIFISPT